MPDLKPLAVVISHNVTTAQQYAEAHELRAFWPRSVADLKNLERLPRVLAPDWALHPRAESLAAWWAELAPTPGKPLN